MNQFNPNRDGAELSSVAAASESQGKNKIAQAPDSAAPNLTSHKFALRLLRAEAEIRAISRALEQTGWNRRRAADLLSISYRGLLYKIRQYDITTSTTASQLAGMEDVKAD